MTHSLNFQFLNESYSEMAWKKTTNTIASTTFIQQCEINVNTEGEGQKCKAAETRHKQENGDGFCWPRDEGHRCCVAPRYSNFSLKDLATTQIVAEGNRSQGSHSDALKETDWVQAFSKDKGTFSSRIRQINEIRFDNFLWWLTKFCYQRKASTHESQKLVIGFCNVTKLQQPLALDYPK